MRYALLYTPVVIVITRTDINTISIEKRRPAWPTIHLSFRVYINELKLSWEITDAS
jgi:hypothetical protein